MKTEESRWIEHQADYLFNAAHFLCFSICDSFQLVMETTVEFKQLKTLSFL
ncbi:hypothetical protein D1BOALGB6SA_602 [Olavius sp. associated proteobacterium Delta 1]|nr:hypothetical protein D1BOALGB6SA_602 [Olavius sp. associated proteobacterium Delta 1]